MSDIAHEPSGPELLVQTKERGRMEQLFNITVFVLFFALWAAFGYALVVNQGGLDSAWQWARSLPLIVQAVVAILFLPVAVGLWIWETSWPLVVRLVLIVGIGGWNIWMFFPFRR
jgi:hypothetical protein